MKTFAEYIGEAMDLNHPEFVRYGGLSSVPQNGYKPEDHKDITFHTPPARRGIYAFVKGFVEPFLLGGSEFDSRRMEYIRDGKGEIVTDKHPEYEKRMDRAEMKGMTRPYKGGFAMIKHKSPVTFKYKGEIWSHLGDRMDRSQILKTQGSWVLTDMATYIKALKKEAGSTKDFKRRTGYGVSSDHMEVFIEKI